MEPKETWCIIDHGDKLNCSECGSTASAVRIDHVYMKASPRCLVHSRGGRAFNKRVHKAKANAKYDGVT